MSNVHIPVLLNESIAGLNVQPNNIYVDMTLGRGGHFAEILKKLNNTGFALGIDQDDEAIKECFNKLNKTNYRNYKIVKNNFKNIDQILNEFSLDKVDGFIFDLGVSSPQFDNPDRGFSYQHNGKLDMRMDQNNTLDAYKVVNTYELEKLEKIFREYGEEKFAYSISKNIIEYRKKKDIETTFELVDIIKKSIPKKYLEKKGHPAKQVFQALRIEVNDELNSLKKALISCLEHLKVNGRICVISFHSLEDKIVKYIFKEKTEKNSIYMNRNLIIDKKNNFKLINKKVIIPDADEASNNRRSKSAKLRIIERIC